MATALQALSGEGIRISLRCECIVVTVTLHGQRCPRFVPETLLRKGQCASPGVTCEYSEVDVTYESATTLSNAANPSGV